MTALGVNMSDTDVTHDWTGLISGHQRPAKVQATYDAMIEAEAGSIWMADAYEEERATWSMMDVARRVASHYRQEYSRIYKVWQTSLEPCECRPIDADRDYTCAACRAKAELSDDGEMPY